MPNCDGCREFDAYKERAEDAEQKLAELKEAAYAAPDDFVRGLLDDLRGSGLHIDTRRELCRAWEEFMGTCGHTMTNWATEYEDALGAEESAPDDEQTGQDAPAADKDGE